MVILAPRLASWTKPGALETHYRVLDIRTPRGEREGMVAFSTIGVRDAALRLVDVRVPFAGYGEGGLRYVDLSLEQAYEHRKPGQARRKARSGALAGRIEDGVAQALLERILEHANPLLAQAQRYVPAASRIPRGAHLANSYAGMFSKGLVAAMQRPENRVYLLTGKSLRIPIEQLLARM